MPIDQSGMKKVIIDSPKQFGAVLESAKDIKAAGPFENIIICGVGGSALFANIFIAWLEQEKIKTPPLYIHRDYSLPVYASQNSLIVCVSFSGNTEETISALEAALKNNFKAIAISSNGKLEKICREKNIPLVKIPGGIQPRSGTGYLFSALFKILANSGIIPDKSGEILETARNLEKICAEQEELAKKLAKKLVNKIPIVYASNHWKAIARVWKIKFNENSKTPAFYNYFPELNHNEMVGFSNASLNKNFHLLILRDKNDHPRNLKRMELFAELTKEKGLNADFIDIKEGGALFKIFSALLLGDWLSYYLSLEYGVDPTPVKMVEEFKKRLEE